MGLFPSLSQLFQSESPRGRRPARRDLARARPMRLEALEDRQLLAASLTATLIDGTLRIEGTEGSDTISVRQADGRISVDGVAIRIEDTKVTVPSVDAGRVSRVDVFALGGGDTVSLGGLNQFDPLVIDASVDGGAGDDTLTGGAGNDVLNGEGDNDNLTGGTGVDTLNGGAGTDRVVEVVEAIDSRLDLRDDQLVRFFQFTVSETDSLTSIERATLTGKTGNDTLDASQFSGPVILNGGAGHDTLMGGNGPDILLGGAGDDTLTGGEGDDTLTGGTWSDTLSGGAGTDRVAEVVEATDTRLDLRDDQLVRYFQFPVSETDSLSSMERATINGNAGNNILDASQFSGSVTLNGGAGHDILIGGASPDTLTGGEGEDTLVGGAGDDTLDGGDGDDVLTGGFGFDSLSGGAGADRVADTTHSRMIVTNSQLINFVQFDVSDTDSLSSIEWATLTGDFGPNILDASQFSGSAKLVGGAGDDVLIGGAGNDTLLGGDGADMLNGGPGINTYDHGQTAATRHRVLYVQFDLDATISANTLQGWAGTGWNALDLTGGLNQLDVDPLMAGQATREAVINRVMELLGEDFRPFGIDVVRLNPGELAVTGQRATTVFVGPAVIGQGNPFGNSSDVDVGNDNQTDVSVVRRLEGNNDAERAQFIANVIAHEAGHTYGLEHVDNQVTVNGVNQTLNELMVHGFLSSADQFARNNFTFLDRFLSTDLLQGGPPFQNSYRKLMASMGITSFPSGPQGVPVNAVSGDVAGGSVAFDFGDGGAMCAAAAAAPEAFALPPTGDEVESPVFLHRLKPAEFVVFRTAAADGPARSADLEAPPADLSPRREGGEAEPELEAGLSRLDADLLDRALS